MLTHKEMISIQAEKHWMIDPDSFKSIQDYVLHLIGVASYEQASKLVVNKKVLDLGCNTGFGTEIIARNAFNVIGVDVSDKALSIATNKYQQTNLNFQKVDGVTLPFPDNSFDVIVSFQVIEHIVNYDTYINEICRVLSPKGIVMFTTPNSYIRLDPGMRPWNKFHVREFTNSELSTLLNKYFTQVKVMGLFAHEPMYSIEYERLQRTLRIARKNSTDPIRKLLHNVFPDEMILQVKKILGSLNPQKENKEEIVQFIVKNKIDAIYYLPENFEKALDYLAICSNDNETLDNAWKSLPNS